MLMTGCETVRVVGSCPSLPPPPEAAVAALRSADDPAVDRWAVELANHYDKLDACLGR